MRHGGIQLASFRALRRLPMTLTNKTSAEKVTDLFGKNSGGQGVNPWPFFTNLLTLAEHVPVTVLGRSAPLARGTLTGAGRSALGAFGHLQGVIHLDAKVFHGALKLAMAKQELHGPQVLRTPVDQCRLGPAERKGAVLLRIAADEAPPALQDPCVLPDREMERIMLPTWEQVLRR